VDTQPIVDNKKGPVIAVVGACASGKSTLAHNLRKHGFSVRHIAQEHSFVGDMWSRLTNPDILIYLEVSFEQSQKRRQPSCSKEEYDKQLDRLKHARAHADYLIETDLLTPDQVANRALKFLKK
jgi:deoxyadenosine/deoxycytidine kinase